MGGGHARRVDEPPVQELRSLHDGTICDAVLRGQRGGRDTKALGTAAHRVARLHDVKARSRGIRHLQHLARLKVGTKPVEARDRGDGDAAGRANTPDGVARDDGVGVAARAGGDVARRGDGGEEQRGQEGERERP